MKGFSSKVLTSTGAVKTGPGRVGAISLAAGASAAATVTLDDSTAGGGTSKWKLAAAQGEGDSISFDEPVLFGTGIYATLSGANAAVSVSYE